MVPFNQERNVVDRENTPRLGAGSTTRAATAGWVMRESSHAPVAYSLALKTARREAHDPVPPSALSRSSPKTRATSVSVGSPGSRISVQSRPRQPSQHPAAKTRVTTTYRELMPPLIVRCGAVPAREAGQSGG